MNIEPLYKYNHDHCESCGNVTRLERVKGYTFHDVVFYTFLGDVVTYLLLKIFSII